MPTCWLLNCKRWYCNMSDWKQLQYYFQSSSFRQRGISFPWNKFRHIIVWVCRIPVHSHPVLHTHYLNSCSYSWWIELKMWLTMVTLKGNILHPPTLVIDPIDWPAFLSAVISVMPKYGWFARSRTICKIKVKRIVTRQQVAERWLDLKG